MGSEVMDVLVRRTEDDGTKTDIWVQFTRLDLKEKEEEVKRTKNEWGKAMDEMLSFDLIDTDQPGVFAYLLTAGAPPTSLTTSISGQD